MGDFAKQVEAFVDKTKGRLDAFTRKVAIDTYERVRMKSPVDTGQLRASWTVSKSSPPTAFDGSREIVTSVKFGDSIFVATDKPYAPVIEYGLYPKPGRGKTANGFSIQAPKGMVRITVQEMESVIRKSAGG